MEGSCSTQLLGTLMRLEADQICKSGNLLYLLPKFTTFRICSKSQTFFLFLEIFIQNMQFIYTDICLNNLRYELHKLHFPNFSRLFSPPMARAQTTLYIKKKNSNF